MNDSHELIAAFADGEPVSAPDLEAALAHEGGRAYLIDLLAIRGLVNDARPVAGQPGPAKSTTSVRRVSGWRVLGAVAAAIVCVAGGYTAGRAAGQRVEIRTEVAGTVTAPAPTHVIRMENGVNWNERAGGN